MKEKNSNPYIIEKQKEKRMVLITEIIILGLFIGLWELSARINIINDFLFSYPSQIFKLIVNYFQTGEIYKHIGISLLETMLGLFIGTIIGIIVSWIFSALGSYTTFTLVRKVLNAPFRRKIKVSWTEKD